MREPAEARDDVAMMHGVAYETLDERPPRGRDRMDHGIDRIDVALLLGERLAVVKGMEQEDAPGRRQDPVEAARDGALRDGDGVRVVLERPGRVAVAVPRELVEQDNQGQCPFRGCFPVVQVPASGRVEGGAEAGPDQFIEPFARAVPEISAAVCRFRVLPGVLEPEAQNAAGRNVRWRVALGQGQEPVRYQAPAAAEDVRVETTYPPNSPATSSATARTSSIRSNPPSWAQRW